MASSCDSVRQKSWSIVEGNCGGGIPVSTCTMGAMVRRISASLARRRGFPLLPLHLPLPMPVLFWVGGDMVSFVCSYVVRRYGTRWWRSTERVMLFEWCKRKSLYEPKVGGYVIGSVCLMRYENAEHCRWTGLA